MFWFSIQLLSETFLILRRIERDMITNIYWSSCTIPFILSDFNPLKTKRRPLYLKSSLYRAVNTFHLGCKNQSVMLYGAEIAVYSEIKYKTYEYSVGRKYNYWMLNLLVYHMTSRLLKVNETWIFWQIFEKSSNIKLFENPSNGSRVVPCGWTDRHDANRLFRNFV